MGAVLVCAEFSIHALLAESDCSQRQGDCLQTVFLSTLSLRRATGVPRRVSDFHTFSIHALLAESDARPSSLGYRYRFFYPRSPCGERPDGLFFFGRRKIFYPRSPCGERHELNSSWISSINFLSTLSLRRATSGKSTTLTRIAYFSIHALLAESDGRT